MLLLSLGFLIFVKGFAAIVCAWQGIDALVASQPMRNEACFRQALCLIRASAATFLA